MAGTGAFGFYSNAQSKPWTESGDYDKSRYKYNGYDAGAAHERANLATRQQRVEERTAPQMTGASMTGAQLDQTDSNETRGHVMGSLAGLQSAAAGATPSKAEILTKQAGDRAARAQVSAAGTVRGGPGAQAAAYRAASQQAAGNAADIAATAGATRADEMATARGQLASASTAARGLDLNAATTNAQLQQDTNKTNAGFQQDTAKTNLGAQQQTTALNDQRAMGYEGMRQHVSDAELEANLRQQGIAAQYGQQSDALNTQTNQKNADRNWNLFTGMVGAGQGLIGGIGKAFSDPATKTPIAGSLASLGLGGTPEGAGGTVDIGSKGFASADDIQRASAGSDAGFGMVGGGGLTGGNGTPGGFMSDEKTKEPYSPGKRSSAWVGRASKGGAGDFGSKRASAPGRLAERSDDQPGEGSITGGGAPPVKSRSALIEEIERGTADAKPYERDPEMAKGVAGAPRGYSNGRAAPEEDSVSWSKPDTWGMNKPAKERPDVSGQAPGTDDWNRYGTGAKKDGSTDWNKGGQDAAPTAEGRPGVFEAIFGGLGGAQTFQPRDTATSDAKAKQAAFERGVESGLAKGAETQLAPGDKRDTRTPEQYDKDMAEARENARPKASGVIHKSQYSSEPAKKSSNPFAGATAKGSHLTDREEAARTSEAAADATFAPNPDGSYNVPTPLDPLAGGINVMRAQAERYGGLGVNQPRVVAASDERTKEGFSKPSDEDMADAMRSMDPAVYAYKGKFTPPDQKPGEVNVGPMANKMAEDPVARTAIVRDDKSGMLAIDKTKLEKVIAGSLASLQHQIDDLEDDVPRAVRAKRSRRAESHA